MQNKEHRKNEYRLTKIKSINSGSEFIQIGDEYCGFFLRQPMVGERFTFISDVFISTSMVFEFIDIYTFKTQNSIYKLISLSDDDRDEKISNLI